MILSARENNALLRGMRGMGASVTPGVTAIPPGYVGPPVCGGLPYGAPGYANCLQEQENLVASNPNNLPGATAPYNALIAAVTAKKSPMQAALAAQAVDGSTPAVRNPITASLLVNPVTNMPLPAGSEGPLPVAASIAPQVIGTVPGASPVTSVVWPNANTGVV